MLTCPVCIACSGLVVGRLLVGVGIGISAVVVPAYLGEVAPAEARGRIVEVYEVRSQQGQSLLLAVLCSQIAHISSSHGLLNKSPYATCSKAQPTASRVYGHCISRSATLPISLYEQVLLCVGMLLAVAADVLVDWLLHQSFGAWRWMVGLPIVPALLMSGMP